MRKALAAGVCALALIAGFTTTRAFAEPAPAAREIGNPLLAAWTGPHGRYPNFPAYRINDFKPALEVAIAEKRQEVRAIADNPAPATFENTILPMEEAGRTLGRIEVMYDLWKNNLSTPEFQAVQNEMDPKLAAFNDEVAQDPRLMARVAKVYESRESAGLTPEQQRLTWVYWSTFRLAGAQLAGPQKARVAEINERLATLYGTFSQNLLADEAGWVTYLKAEDLAGLPPGYRVAAAAAAAARGHKGEWAVINTASWVGPFLTYSDRRDLREKVWRAFYARGDNHDAHDNSAIITEILKLRTERARLLGFPTYAHWKLSNKMAKTPEAAMALMMQVWPAAIARVGEEVHDMQALADREGHGVTIAPWDYRYYAEKVRKAKYDLDESEIKPYLQLDGIRDAVFWEAGRLYGFSFKRLDDVPVFHPDVTVYEVLGRDGKRVGLWYLDPYAREGKNSGAWETPYRVQTRLFGGETPIVSNNANFVKGEPGRPLLISWDDAETVFHEFGHALHDLNSNVTYPSLAGTSVAADFGELPSLLNENWLSTPEVLSRFAVDEKGRAIPQALVDKIHKASTFNQGFAVTEYLASAIVDMKMHLAADRTIDPDAFERETMDALGMPKEMALRHRPTQFGHLFQSEEYAAGYYSYLWSWVLAYDAFEAFQEAGGPYDKVMAARYHDDIVSVGGSVDPAEAYRRFRGRDATIDAYLRAKGFPVASGSRR